MRLIFANRKFFLINVKNTWGIKKTIGRVEGGKITDMADIDSKTYIVNGIGERFGKLIKLIVDFGKRETYDSLNYDKWEFGEEREKS